jgi:Spy/CpxP family protein refolding chaperone
MMRLKVALVLTGVLGAAAIAAPIAAQPVPFDSRPFPPEHIDDRNFSPSEAGRDRSHPPEDLNLTSEQKQKISRINEKLKSRIEDILDSDQRNRLREKLASGENLQSAIADLDLSNHQQNELQDALRSANENIEGQLTSEQRRRLHPH